MLPSLVSATKEALCGAGEALSPAADKVNIGTYKDEAG